MMSGVWNTKYGLRRVRHDPPTLDEAIFAARGLTDDPKAQIEIAASLMEVSQEEVKVAMLKASQRKDVHRNRVFTMQAGTDRAVLVERKPSRRIGGVKR
jgi:hypothetical protein